MARGRLSDRARASQAIWPGFVDAMTALLLVLMFVLSIFMIVQFVLRATISGQESKLDELGLQLAQLSNVLAMEQDRSEGLEHNLTLTRANLEERSTEADRLATLVATLTGQRNDLTSRVASFEAQVASLLVDKSGLERVLASSRDNAAGLQSALASSQTNADDLNDQLTASDEEIARLRDANAKVISASEALQLALARARDEIDVGVEAARLAAARREAMDALIASLQVDKARLQTDKAAGQAAFTQLAAAKASDEALIAELEAAKAAGLTAISTLEADKAANLALIAVLESDKASLTDETALLSQEKIDRLQSLADLKAALTEEERQKLIEAAAVEALREKLRNADAELTAMTLVLEEQRREAEDTLTLLAAAEAARNQLDLNLNSEITERDKERALLATAQKLLSERQTQISVQDKNLALLNAQAVELRNQLAALSSQLDSSEAKDAAQQVQIANLGSRLNAALARELQEQAKEAARLRKEANDLATYRSEFFGEMRKALGDRQDIRIVGDRFVFQSEVLFPPGSALLGFEGRSELSRLGDAIREVSLRIPSQIDWILVVEGHTDNLPVSGNGQYRDNWELSQGRALSVVRYLAEFQGLPPERLAALGYGEYQPIDFENSVAARARNRRIEVKFTERPPRAQAVRLPE
jgi:chemotaxis protein MotB